MFQFDNTKFGPEAVAREVAEAKRETSVSQVVALLWRAKYLAIAGAVAMVVTALLFSVVVKPSYEASALVYIDPQDLQLLQNDISSRPPSGDSGAMFVESQSRIMQSDEVMRDVVTRLDLLNDTEFASKARGGDAELMLQGTIDNLSSAVRVVHADRTYVIEIYARSEDAHKAATIANAVVNSYLAVREAQRAQQAASATKAIEKRLADLRDDVTAKEDAVDAFKAANGIVTANGSNLIESRLNDANAALSATQRAMDEAKTRLTLLDVAKTDPAQFLASPDAVSSPDLQRLRGEYDQAVTALQTEMATLGPKHPSVIRAQGQVNSVSRSITTMANRLRTSAKLQYDNAVGDYNAALAAVKTLTTTFQSNDGAQVQLRQLTRDAESSKAVYEDALLRSRQTREQEQINTANVQVISQATAPIQKRFPPRLTVLIPLAIVLGLALGAGLSVLLEMWPVRLKRSSGKAAKPAKSAPPPAEPVPARGGILRYAALPDREQGSRVH